MNRLLLTTAGAIAVTLACCHSPVALAGNGQPLNTVVGYLNFQEVRAKYPPAATLDRLKVELEVRLQLAVYQANLQLEKLQKDGKPKSEIEKVQEALQHEMKGRQEAASETIQAQTIIVNSSLGSAVMQVAKEKGVDIVIDSSGILLGGQKITDTGIDITDLVKKKLIALQTEAPKPAEKSADKSESETNKTTGKEGP